MAKASKLTDLLGKKVTIEWKDDSDWNSFKVLGIDNGMICIKGICDGDAPHDGDQFWAQLSDISEIHAN